MTVEERLARLEERQVANAEVLHTGVTALSINMEDGFRRMTDRLDAINGNVRANTAFRHEHTKGHAREDGQRDGYASTRRRDLAMLTIVIALANLFSPWLRPFVEQWLGGPP